VPEALGGRVSCDVFEICVAPPEAEAADGGDGAASRERILAASGLGQQHFIGPDCNLVGARRARSLAARRHSAPPASVHRRAS